VGSGLGSCATGGGDGAEIGACGGAGLTSTGGGDGALCWLTGGGDGLAGSATVGGGVGVPGVCGGDGLPGSATVGGGIGAPGTAPLGGGMGAPGAAVGGGDGAPGVADVGGGDGAPGTATAGGGEGAPGAPGAATMPNTSCRSMLVPGLPVPLVSRRTVPSGPVTVNAIVPGGAARKRHETQHKHRQGTTVADVSMAASATELLCDLKAASEVPCIADSASENALQDCYRACRSGAGIHEVHRRRRDTGRRRTSVSGRRALHAVGAPRWQTLARGIPGHAERRLHAAAGLRRQADGAGRHAGGRHAAAETPRRAHAECPRQVLSGQVIRSAHTLQRT